MSRDGLAVLRGLDGGWIGVEGPFLASEQPSETLPSFYVNNFGLGDPLPWKLGRRLLDEEELTTVLSPPGTRPPRVNWSPVETARFARVFEEIQHRIAGGELEKAVPVTVARGRLDGPGEGLLGRLLEATPGLLAYGLFEDSRGFCGLSPEILFRAEGRRLETVALAGTARAEQGEALLDDPKEVREHELVAGYLYDKLATLGQVKRHPRSLRQLGEMVHLESRFELRLESHWRVEELIAKLHPTPALGTQPRTGEALADLERWRRELGVPPGFGAPFGVYWQGRLEILVAIRGLWWEHEHVALPSGCGVIGQSVLERELAELELKRDWVRQRFGLT